MNRASLLRDLTASSSPLIHSVYAPLSLFPMNTPPSRLQQQAILLLHQSVLSQDDQLTIEAAITNLSLQRRCTRQQAAQLLHHAFP